MSFDKSQLLSLISKGESVNDHLLAFLARETVNPALAEQPAPD